MQVTLGTIASVLLVSPAAVAAPSVVQPAGIRADVRQASQAEVPAELRRAIERSRYEIEADAAQPGLFRAANPRQGFTAVFRASGVEVMFGSGGAAWGMRLESHGRADEMAPAAGAEVVAEGNRIEYRRGEVTEWYVNDRRGIEQGFTIAQRPPGSGDLVVDLAMSGGLAARRAGRDLAFEGAGARLGYAKLHAFDATGEPLPARMEVARPSGMEVVRLSVDDEAATYPVVIDPLIFNDMKLVAADPVADESFGFSVSISGDTAVVGAWRDDDAGSDSGSAYVFQRDAGGTGSWGQLKKLTASDAEAFHRFGVSVSISGDAVVIGANGDDDGGNSSGAAYLYERDVGGTDNWGQVKKLVASDAGAGDFFGDSVSISADTVVIGSDSGSGSAYVFQRDAGGVDNWGEVKKLTASDAAAGDDFGSSVSISGDTAVVGARFDDDDGTSSGSAYVYQRDAGGLDNWGEVKKLTASDATASDRFGTSVSISGDTTVVGAPAGDGGAAGSGSAYVYQRDAGGLDSWGEAKKLIASDAAILAAFGSSVAVSGDIAVVGAPSDDEGGTNSGASYVYGRDAGGTDNWGEVKKLTAFDAAAGDELGSAVAISGDTALIGAPREDGGGSESGSAYLYDRVEARRAFFFNQLGVDGDVTVAGADFLCGVSAGLAGLDGTWVAWLSTSSVDAKDRLSGNPDMPFVMPNGVKLADDIADLTDGTLDNPLNVTAVGVTAPFAGVWTGTFEDGTHVDGFSCSGWTSTSGVGGIGVAGETGPYWTADSPESCSSTYGLYCFEVFACGDGILEPGEDCDDGNTLDGDCCSSACQYESPGNPCGDADLCNGVETCDGAGTCQPGTPLDCDDANACTQDACLPATGCESTEAPAVGCAEPWGKAALLVKETTPGKERLIAKLVKGPALTQGDFGDPVAGSTIYDICIYDDAGGLAGQMQVDRAGQQCAGKDCWKPVGTKGYLYKDKDLAADGIQVLKMSGGDAGKSKIQITGKNNASKAQLDLPTGITAALQGSTSATLQMHASDAPTACYGVTLDEVSKNEVTFFKAK